MSTGGKRRVVKPRTLLAAAAGAAVVTFNACGGIVPTGNLMALPQCGKDGGPPGCYLPADSGNPDGGSGGDH